MMMLLMVMVMNASGRGRVEWALTRTVCMRCVERRRRSRSGRRGGVAQLLGGTDSCRGGRRLGLRPGGARQLSVRCQVRAGSSAAALICQPRLVLI